MDGHAKGFGDLAGGLADLAEADDAHGLAGELNERIIPEAPVVIMLPAALAYGGTVVSHMVADLQQQRNGKLADGGGAVGRDVGDADALFPGVVIVDDVISRGQNRDVLQIRAGVEDRFADGALVGEDDLSVADALGDDFVVIGRAVIDRQVTEGSQGFPAQITGVFGVAVENYDFHRGHLSFLFIV